MEVWEAQTRVIPLKRPKRSRHRDPKPVLTIQRRLSVGFNRDSASWKSEAAGVIGPAGKEIQASGKYCNNHKDREKGTSPTPFLYRK